MKRGRKREEGAAVTTAEPKGILVRKSSRCRRRSRSKSRRASSGCRSVGRKGRGVGEVHGRLNRTQHFALIPTRLKF